MLLIASGDNAYCSSECMKGISDSCVLPRLQLVPVRILNEHTSSQLPPKLSVYLPVYTALRPKKMSDIQSVPLSFPYFYLLYSFLAYSVAVHFVYACSRQSFTRILATPVLSGFPHIMAAARWGIPERDRNGRSL
jgi:hypothetical protein